jgi:hypothetical protein
MLTRRSCTALRCRDAAYSLCKLWIGISNFAGVTSVDKHCLKSSIEISNGTQTNVLRHLPQTSGRPRNEKSPLLMRVAARWRSAPDFVQSFAARGSEAVAAGAPDRWRDRDENRRPDQPHGAGHGYAARLLGLEGARSKEGYGVLRSGDTQRPATRLFWESFVGIIPPCYRVLSRSLLKCAGKACCNPAHHRLQGPVVEEEIEVCKQGHPLTPENQVVENRNGRQFKRCRICRREAWRNWQKQHSSNTRATHRSKQSQE